MAVNCASIAALLLLVGLAAGRGLMLRRREINASVFGVTDNEKNMLINWLQAVSLLLAETPFAWVF